MWLIAWLRRKRKGVNDDVFTRLDCEELAELQHHARHALIGLRIEQRELRRKVSELASGYVKLSRHIDRLEQALRSENDG